MTFLQSTRYTTPSLSVVYSNLENKFNNCAVLSPSFYVWKITLFILSLTSLYGSREHRCLCALTDMGNNDGLFFSALLYIPRSVCYLCYSRSNS